MSPDLKNPDASAGRGRAAAGSVFHPERLLAVLGRFKVRHVVVGGVAARLHGAPLFATVSEIAVDAASENLDALSAALRHLGARAYAEATPAGVECDLTPVSLASAAHWDFVTSCGRLLIAIDAQFDALATAAERFELHGDTVLVASLADLVRRQEAPDAGATAVHVALLRALQARRPQV